jgi:LITAF-like zinc ribbon domain
MEASIQVNQLKHSNKHLRVATTRTRLTLIPVCMTPEPDTPPMVSASYVTAEPEIDMTAPSAPPAVIASAVEYSAPPPKATSTTVTTYTTAAPATAGHYPLPGTLGRQPCRLNCPYCNVQMTTRTREQISGVTVLAIVLLILLFWPLFWLPLCMPACKDTEHYCGSCNRKVGQESACS